MERRDDVGAAAERGHHACLDLDREGRVVERAVEIDRVVRRVVDVARIGDPDRIPQTVKVARDVDIGVHYVEAVDPRDGDERLPCHQVHVATDAAADFDDGDGAVGIAPRKG